MMSKTILTQVDGFTPLPDLLVKRYGIIAAAVWGRMWRYCQMADGVCRAALDTIAEELDLSRPTIIKHIETLVADGFLFDKTPDLKNKPHIYVDTGKVAMYNRFGFAVNLFDSAVNEIDSESQKDLLEDSIKDTTNKKSIAQRKAAALERKAKQQAEREARDPVLEILKADKQAEPLMEIRCRVETALSLNLSREWDLPKSDWHGYDRLLLEREKETGETIEQFMEWYNADNFRRDGNIWLRPNKIEKVWVRAFAAPADDDRNGIPSPEETRRRIEEQEKGATHGRPANLDQMLRDARARAARERPDA